MVNINGTEASALVKNQAATPKLVELIGVKGGDTVTLTANITSEKITIYGIGYGK